jgi:hypothetical protein
MRRSATLACVITYAGVDYHKKFSMITLGDQSGKFVTTQRLPNERQSIEAFFAEYPNLQVAVESCRGYEWFVDLLKEIGLTVHLANPYQVALIAKTRCKTDKIDSKILMELLAMGFLPTCYQPTPSERRVRERLRWRTHLVRNTTRGNRSSNDTLQKRGAVCKMARLLRMFSASSVAVASNGPAERCGRQRSRQKEIWSRHLADTRRDRCPSADKSGLPS